MGWAAGSDVFNRTAQAFIDQHAAYAEHADTVLTTLAEALIDAGWDTVDESIDEFHDWPEIVAALCRALGERDIAGDGGGTIDYDDGLDQWVLSCARHGVIGRGDGGSAEEHNRLVREWAAHDQQEHGGDGTVDTAALINR